MLEAIIIALVMVIIGLLLFIQHRDEKADGEYEALVKRYEDLKAAYEDEKQLRRTEKQCRKIFFDHYKQQKDKEIELLRKALHGSEEKRKELCTRLWEESELK